MNQTLEVSETFVSLQGESTYAGLPCFFIRLAGCNLRCVYCDTPQSKERGKERSVDELVAECLQERTAIAEVTGGEPLLQAATPLLVQRLHEATGRPVLIETNGTQDIGRLPPDSVAIMDLKCPGSGESAAMDWGNVERLRPQDEVKFVILDRRDYEWARDTEKRCNIARRCHAVLFSPVHGRLEPATLGRWILEDRLPVRLQIQLHKHLGMA